MHFDSSGTVITKRDQERHKSMTPDELIQQMRLTNINLIRTRLMVIEGADPEGYKAICNLFAPVAENQPRWKAAPRKESLR